MLEDEVGTGPLPGLYVPPLVAEAADPVEARLAAIVPELRTASIRFALEDRARRQGNIDKAAEAVESTRAARQLAVDQGNVAEGGRLANVAISIGIELNQEGGGAVVVYDCNPANDGKLHHIVRWSERIEPGTW
jgi:hypothetical protein